jgi:hypothetical protein
MARQTRSAERNMIARKDFTQQISKKATIGGLRTKNYSNDAFPEVITSNFSQGCCRYPTIRRGIPAANCRAGARRLGRR